MNDYLSLFIAAIAVLVAAIVYLGDSSRTDFEVARILHLDLTSGEVAAARQQLGTLRYGDEAAVRRLDPDSALTAYFSVLWCFERIYYGRRSLIEGKILQRRSRAVRFLDRSLDWHLKEWDEGLEIARRRLSALAGFEVSDSQSRAAFVALLRARGIVVDRPNG